MQQQRNNSLFGKRLKCGEVIIWNYDTLFCAVECTLCEDRPSCNLEHFFEHIQIWHQNWNDDDMAKCEVEKDANEFESGNNNLMEVETDIQPFEEVLIEIESNVEEEYNVSDEENFSDYTCDVNNFNVSKTTKFNDEVTENSNGFELNKSKLSVDDLAFEDLNIQCSDIDTSNVTFEEDFKQWCRKQNLIKCQELNSEHSVDSGVDKSDLSSVAASPTQLMSDDHDSFQLSELNIQEQIKFGLNESLTKRKLTADKIEKLIELYREQPHLWQQSHTDYNNAQLARQSWQEIMLKWNKICQVNLNEKDIRLRLSTLRQRYLKERERLELHKEDCNFNTVDYRVSSRFRYFDKLKFLENQYQSLYTARGDRICREYTKLIETYKHFPRLWDKKYLKQKTVELREKAYEGISTALQLLGIHLTIETIRLRLSTLKKRYRLEKIQRLQCQLKGKTFVPRFKHYDEMKYLDDHIAPYVCDLCGKIFRLLNEYHNHKKTENHNDNKISCDPKSETQEIQSLKITEMEKTCSNIEAPQIKNKDTNKSQNEMIDSVLSNNLIDSIKSNCEEIENSSKIIDEESLDVQSKEVLEIDQNRNNVEVTSGEPHNAQANNILTMESDSFENGTDVKIVEENEILKEKLSDEEITTTTLTNQISEHELLMPLEWINGTFNEVPIYIMNTELSEPSQQTTGLIYDPNIFQPGTELQPLILDEAFMKTMNLILTEQHCRVIKPLVATTYCDEIINHKDFSTNAENDNKMRTDKIYTNLENAFIEHTKPENLIEQQTTIIHNNAFIDPNSNVFETENQPKTSTMIVQTIMPKTVQNELLEISTNLEQEYVIKEAENQFSWESSENAFEPANNIELMETFVIDKQIEIPESQLSGESTQSEVPTNIFENYKAIDEDPKLIKTISSISKEIGEILPDESNLNIVNQESLEQNEVSLNISSISNGKEPSTITGIGTSQIKDDRDSKNLSLGELLPTESSLNKMDLETLDHNEIAVNASSVLKEKEPINITEIRILRPKDNGDSNKLNAHFDENVSKNTRLSKAANINDDLQIDVNLCETKESPRKRKPYSLTRLTEPQSLKLIELYRLHPQLWDPEHPSFASRRHKRIAWRAVSTQFNSSFYLNYDWLQVQRKMIDYIKYYKREQKRSKTKRNVTTWSLYDKLKFLDKVNASDSTLEKRLQQRAQSLKIIEVYKEHPQMWDTEHELFTKRHQRQRTIAMMQARLQEAHNITIEHGKLRQCLLDLRYNFRTTKVAKLEAEKRNEAFEPASRFEFYDALNFLEPHVSPFDCKNCNMNFKCFSAYNAHTKKEHKRKLRPQCPLLASDIDKNTLENICHICGIKFTLRHNLVQHLNRHYCERTLACSTCGKKFFTKSALTEHVRTHTKVPAVICSECGRTFFNASKLNQHLKRHRNQRDFPCEYCDKAFYTAFERERHTRRHFNIRDKICPICGKSFVVGSSYYTHIKIHNKTKEYTCVACNLEFSQYAGLYKHRKRHHPDS